jgi:hypothetical protein
VEKLLKPWLPKLSIESKNKLKSLEVSMNLKNLIEERIEDESIKELWREIFEAYVSGGEELVRTLLTQKAKEISEEFEKLLKQLEEKF